MLDDMRREQLKSRLEKLGWTTYKLAHEVAKLREDLYGEKVANPKSLINGLEKALDNPDKSSQRTVELIIRAMNGKPMIEWDEVEVVMKVVGHELVEVEPDIREKTQKDT
jgi:hypothetical protein